MFIWWWKCCGRRPHSPIADPLTAAGTRSLSPLDHQWWLWFYGPTPALVPQLGGSTSPLSQQWLEQRHDVIIVIIIKSTFLIYWVSDMETSVWYSDVYDYACCRWAEESWRTESFAAFPAARVTSTGGHQVTPVDHSVSCYASGNKCFAIIVRWCRWVIRCHSPHTVNFLTEVMFLIQ